MNLHGCKKTDELKYSEKGKLVDRVKDYTWNSAPRISFGCKENTKKSKKTGMSSLIKGAGHLYS